MACSTPTTASQWYDLSLGDLPAAQRRAWAATRRGFPHRRNTRRWKGKVVEIHAGKDYVDFGLATGLIKAGAIVSRPLLGIPIGRHLGWYRGQGVRAEV